MQAVKIFTLVTVLTSSWAYGKTQPFPFPGGIPKRVHDEIKAKARTAAPNPKLDNQDCFDFTGTWDARCVDSEGETNTFVVKLWQFQCEELEINDDIYWQMGGIDNTNVSNPRGFADNANFTIDWNSSRTALKGSFRSNGRILGADFFTKSDSKMTLSRVSDDEIQMISNSKGTFHDGATSSTWSLWSNCALTKR